MGRQNAVKTRDHASTGAGGLCRTLLFGPQIAAICLCNWRCRRGPWTRIHFSTEKQTMTFTSRACAALLAAATLALAGCGGGSPQGSVQVQVSGLYSYPVVFKNNNGDYLTVNPPADNLGDSVTYSFATQIDADSGYDVEVQTQPVAQYCSPTSSLASNTGSMDDNADTVTVAFNCVQTSTIGGRVSGLATGNTVTIGYYYGSTSQPQNSTEVYTPALSGNGTFDFAFNDVSNEFLMVDPNAITVTPAAGAPAQTCTATPTTAISVPAVGTPPAFNFSPQIQIKCQ